MAVKYSIYKYVKLADKGWRYARAAYHPNGDAERLTRQRLRVSEAA
jgi:hypothetical protein